MTSPRIRRDGLRTRRFLDPNCEALDADMMAVYERLSERVPADAHGWDGVTRFAEIFTVSRSAFGESPE